MKFLSSSSSSSASSTTTTSTSGTRKNYVGSRSLIGMIRRILCFNALPTHPFDQTRDFSSEGAQCGELDYGKQAEVKFEVRGDLGIVGRLMGLDSMPDIGLGGSDNSITRSRSMNYADTWREDELARGKHRLIKSTSSFREAPPPFVELETEEFFILSFEGGGKDNELMLKTRKYDKGFAELKQRGREKRRNKNKQRENGYESNKENSAPNMLPNDVSGSQVQDSSKILRPTSKLNQRSDVAEEVVKLPESIGQRQSRERRRSRRKKKENYSTVQKLEIQSDSENSSPVSVFDFSDSPPKPEATNTEEDSRLPNSNSRRRLSAELETQTNKHSSPIITSISTNNDGKADTSEAKNLHSWRNDREFQNHAELWEEVGKLIKSETLESNWMHREPRQLEDFKDIGAAISLEILDQLINEFLELLTSKQDNFAL